MRELACAAGTTTEAEMSSSVWILCAAAKSWRSLKVRQSPVGEEADAEIGADEFAVVEFEFVAGGAVDDVDVEMFAPVAVPFGLVEAFDDEDDGVDVGGNGGEPGVVFVGVIRRGGEQFDDASRASVRRLRMGRDGRLV